MGLDELGDLVRGGLPVDGQIALSQLFGHPGPDHVDPEDRPGPSVGRLLGHHLHQSVGLPDDPGPAVPPKGSFLTTISIPVSRAWASVIPTKATSGWQ